VADVIDIVDLGLGNIRSVQRMIEKVGGTARFVTFPEEIAISKKLILPGVGHFDEGMKSLRTTGLLNIIRTRLTNEHLPVLGICLGMQLLCRTSEEGTGPGIGLIDAVVRKFQFKEDLKLKVPHMGWNEIEISKENPLIVPDDEEQRFYFVHSYRVVPMDKNIVIATANYGGGFCAAFQKDHIFGVQFHPEKSHRFGLALLKHFVEL